MPTTTLADPSAGYLYDDASKWEGSDRCGVTVLSARVVCASGGYHTRAEPA